MKIIAIQNIRQISVTATSKISQYKVVISNTPNQRIIRITQLSKDVFRGYSAYEIAVKDGFIGTEVEWLASLPGKDADLSILGNYERDFAQDFLMALNT